jgi:hypothetical protein
MSQCIVYVFLNLCLRKNMGPILQCVWKVTVPLGYGTVWIQACINACAHHFQHLLYVHSDFPNADLQKVSVNKIKQVQACIDTHGHHFQHLV